MQEIIIILLFLLVRVFSFLSLYLVTYLFLLVIVASEVRKVETIQKIKNDVRKNTRQKKIIDIEIKKIVLLFSPGLQVIPQRGGTVAKLA